MFNLIYPLKEVELKERVNFRTNRINKSYYCCLSTWNNIPRHQRFLIWLKNKLLILFLVYGEFKKYDRVAK